MSQPAELTVVVCSLNGAAGVDRCLSALRAQTVADRLQLVVVDDGSSDDTSAVGHRYGATVIRHEVNRGLAAARNSGVAAAEAAIVGFLDDDCEPEPGWAQALLRPYQDPAVIAVGGPVDVTGPDSFVVRYLRRHNPLLPLELELSGGNGLLYRLGLYLRRQWTVGGAAADEGRDVFAVVGANMSFRLAALEQVGGFDERFTFGAEELELCLRLRDAFPGRPMRLAADARVRHHYDTRLVDTLRRSRAYGRGTARLHRVRRSVPLTVFPVPVVAAGLLLSGAVTRRPLLALAGAAVPIVAFPQGPWLALGQRSAEPLADPWLQAVQEALGNVGVAEGWWRFRHLPEPTLPARRELPAIDKELIPS